MAKLARELVVVSGMSGAGKSTVAHALEDGGWYVVDNLPPSLISSLFQSMENSHSEQEGIAVVVDVRGRELFDDLTRALSEIADMGIQRRVIFIDASDDSLVRRFESTRRPHPLQAGDRILDGINREREKLRELRSNADFVIDTSDLNIHQLDKKIGDLFQNHDRVDLRINLLSFGYKYGLPVDSDLVMDCRFIANPHWDVELRPLNGQDQPVKARVLSSEGVDDFLTRYLDLISAVIPGYIREGKKFITLAIGCTGGKHRSVAIAQELYGRFNKMKTGNKISIQVIHRDLGRER
ncbi:MAG: RNase adapter RapZ [Actinomycetota bacterium]|nr:RNase adapter RapZ [Actinomycetota bacterium]